jgi:hypothetical protein
MAELYRQKVTDRAAAVLSAREFWDVEEAWLVELLPAVHRLLQVHGEHGVRFGDSDDLNLAYHSSEEWFDWLMEAGLALEEYPYLEAEDIAEALSYAAWRAEEVEVPLRHP